MYDAKKFKALLNLLSYFHSYPPNGNLNKQLLIKSFNLKTSNDRFKRWELLNTIYNAGIISQLKPNATDSEILEVLKNFFVKTFNLKDINDFEQKYAKKIEAAGISTSLCTYQSSLFSYLPSYKYQEIIFLLTKFVTGILEETYPSYFIQMVLLSIRQYIGWKNSPNCRKK